MSVLQVEAVIKILTNKRQVSKRAEPFRDPDDYVLMKSRDTSRLLIQYFDNKALISCFPNDVCSRVIICDIDGVFGAREKSRRPSRDSSNSSAHK